jgi:hypothetical protein
MRHNIARDYNYFMSQSDNLLEVYMGLFKINPKLQKLVAELLYLRLAYLIEQSSESIVCKLCCGAPYCDGSLPNLMLRYRSKNAAASAMKTAIGREPKWNDTQSIRKNIQGIIDRTDHCSIVLSGFAASYTQIKTIRNHIAHRSENTRKKYAHVVSYYYGARLPSVTPGTLLLSTRNHPPLLERHIRESRVFLKDLVRA